MINWKLQEVNIKNIKSHSKNPRQISRDKLNNLANLVKKFGLIDKPILNKDLTIIGGHQRIKLLKKQKLKKVECWVAESLLSDDEVDELCIGLNLHQGSWDFDILANEWDPLNLLEYGFTEEQLLGTCKEAEEILEKIEEKKAEKEKLCPNCGHDLKK